MFFFIQLVFSARWWEFNQKEFNLMRANLSNEPIFAVCTLPTCPHCVHIPDKLKNFAKTVANNTNIIFTRISCEKEPVCQELAIRAVPTFAFLNHKNSKYWEITLDQDAHSWATFLKQHYGSHISPLKYPQEIVEKMNFHTGETTLFLLLLEQRDKALLNRYKKLSAQYRSIGSEFFYVYYSHTLSQSEKSPEIRAYYSPTCYESKIINRVSISTFVSNNLFNNYHIYDYSEYKEAIKSKNLLLFFVKQNIQVDMLWAVASKLGNQNCSSFKIGFVVGQEINKFANLTKRKLSDAPFDAAFSVNEECVTVGKNIGLTSLKEIENALHNEKCVSKGIYSKKNKTEGNPGETKRENLEKGNIETLNQKTIFFRGLHQKTHTIYDNEIIGKEEMMDVIHVDKNYQEPTENKNFISEFSLANGFGVFLCIVSFVSLVAFFIKESRMDFKKDF